MNIQIWILNHRRYSIDKIQYFAAIYILILFKFLNSIKDSYWFGRSSKYCDILQQMFSMKNSVKGYSHGTSRMWLRQLDVNVIVLIDDLIASNRIDPFVLRCHYAFTEFGFCFESNTMNIRMHDSRNVLKCW